MNINLLVTLLVLRIHGSILQITYLLYYQSQDQLD